MALQVSGITPEPSANVDFIATFKRYGLLLIGVPAVIVALVVGFVMYSVIIRDFGTVFALGMSGTVSEAYDAETFVHDPTSSEYSHLSEMVAKRVSSGRLTAMRVQDLEGTVIFSTDSDEIGMVLPFDGRAIAAIEKSEVGSYVTSDDPLLSDHEASSLVVVGPVTLTGDKDPVGVIAAYKPFSSVSPSISKSVLTVSITVLFGAMVAYVLLRLLLLRAERRIEEGDQLVETVNRRLGRSVSELERTHLGTLQTLNAAVDAKDRYTALHSLHVADYACALGTHQGVEGFELLERAGLLHDIGKIGIAESVLQKSGALTEDEFAAIRKHGVIGATMIETVPFLADLAPAVRHHHERWDGTGYPDGLVADETPLLARILAIADAFDAMTTTRPYQSPMSVAAARAELMSCRGTQFDPKLTDAFIELIDEHVIVVEDPS